MKIFVGLMSFSLLLPSILWSSELSKLEGEIKKLYNDVSPSIVSIQYGSKDNPDFIGTGVVIDGKGHIVTIKRFLKGDNIWVETNVGEQLDAELLGADSETGLAVLKVKKSLKPIRVYSSNALAPGDLLFIVGNSFGLKNGISISVFSGKREGEDYFQLGNTVLPGHSGAGVFNSKGEFVGIVSFTLGTSVFYAQPEKGAVLKKEFRLGISPDIGISAGFGGPGVVIPQNKVMELSKEIIRSGKIERGWLGVFIDEKKGVVIVKEIVDDSPAQVGGIEKGDKILKYGNKQVKDLRDFIRMVKETKPGTKVSIGIERDKKNIDIEVNIDKRPNEEKLFRFKEIISPFKMLFEKTELERLKKEIEKLKEELKRIEED